MTWFRIGTSFLRRYVLIGPIGHGGVSIVYQALDTTRAQAMAIKILDPQLAGDSRAGAKIRREALITDRMRHPSVPRIYDFGDAPLPDGTMVPYVVMELLTGGVLAQRLAEGALPWPDAVTVAATVADVLAVAHRRGVVHRDLTAANVMLTHTGAKIIDFGLAVTIPDPRRPTHRYHLAGGTPGDDFTNDDFGGDDFGGDGEPADDVYALGVLLYHMVTGESPLPGNIPASTFGGGGLRFVAPTPVLSVPGLPRQIGEICRACMARRPQQRPSAVTVALDLWSLVMPATPQPAPPALAPSTTPWPPR